RELPSGPRSNRRFARSSTGSCRPCERKRLTRSRRFGPGHTAWSFAPGDVGLRCFASIPLIAEQLVGDVVLVDVTDVGDRFPADSLRGNALDIAEPQVRIEASLFRLGSELSDPSRPGVVGRKGHQTFVQIVHGIVL